MHRDHGLPLDADLERRVEAFARATNSTPSDVLRTAFEEYGVNHNGCREVAVGEESAYAAFTRADAIGCVKGSPSDLSTHPKYMEGFGRD